MHQTYILPLIFAVIGLYILSYAFGITTIYIRQLLRFRSKQQAIAVGLLFTIIGFGISRLVFNDQNTTFNHLKKIYEHGQYLEVKGRVTNYHPSNDQAHDSERFDVDSVHFKFMDDKTYSYGYTRSKLRNGVFRPGLYVRIKYYNNGYRNVILRLETE